MPHVVHASPQMEQNIARKQDGDVLHSGGKGSGGVRKKEEGTLWQKMCVCMSEG